MHCHFCLLHRNLFSILFNLYNYTEWTMLMSLLHRIFEFYWVFNFENVFSFGLTLTHILQQQSQRKKIVLTFSVQNWNMIGGQTSFCFDSNQKRWTTTRCNTFIWKMFWFKRQSKCAFLVYFRLRYVICQNRNKPIKRNYEKMKTISLINREGMKNKNNVWCALNASGGRINFKRIYALYINNKIVVYSDSPIVEWLIRLIHGTSNLDVYGINDKRVSRLFLCPSLIRMSDLWFPNNFWHLYSWWWYHCGLQRMNDRYRNVVDVNLFRLEHREWPNVYERCRHVCTVQIQLLPCHLRKLNSVKTGKID